MLRFVVAELLHEWLFAAGVSLAVCSVLTPAMLLWGVKNGLVSSLRDHLVNDPRTREIRPSETVDIPRTWITATSRSPLTAFMVPSVRQISLYGRARKAPNGVWVKLDDIFPSSAGDPLGSNPEMSWTSEAAPVPCMLSQEAATALGAVINDKILVEQNRIVGDKEERKSLPVVVRKIIASSLSPSTALYLPVGVIERIEDFKDGQAVESFGWPGTQSQVRRTYHGCLVRLDGQASSGAAVEKVKQLFGDATVQLPAHAAASAHVRCPEYQDNSVLLLQFPEADFDKEKLGRLLDSDAGRSIKGLLPFVEPTPASMAGTSGLTIRTGADRWYSVAEARELFANTKTVPREPGGNPVMLQVGTASPPSQLILLFKSRPLQVVELPPEQAGLVGTALKRPARYNQETGSFRFDRQNYAGFRLYARTIDDVPELRALCDKAGIKVETQETRIQQVRTLDESLSQVVYLIASLSLAGGFGALFASLYLSVERGRRQFSVLQVLGVPASLVLLSILIQSTLLVGIGGVSAAGFYYVGAKVLQALFGRLLNDGDAVCRLEPAHLTVFAVYSIGSGLLAGIFASFRLRGMDAATIARGE